MKKIFVFIINHKSSIKYLYLGTLVPKNIRENIRIPCLAFSRRLRVTFKLFLSSYSPKFAMGDLHC